jgi:hypothetical protein
VTEPDLRPMTLGEVLDRTFKLYRNYFWLFVGISAIPHLFVLLLEVASAKFTFTAASALQTAGVTPAAMGRWYFAFLGLALVNAVMAAIAHAAAVFAVSDLYLAQPTSVRSAYAKLGLKIFRVLLILFLLFVVFSIAFAIAGIAMAVVIAVLAALVGAVAGPLLGGILAIILALGLVAAAIFMFCRVALSVPVAMIEDMGAVRSIERSIHLTKGYAGQIFLIGLLATLISYIAVILLQSPFLVLAYTSPVHRHFSLGFTILQDLAGFIGGVVAGPIGAIGFALMYYNLRVRKEAFDLQHLMGSLETTPPADISPAV